MATYFIADLHLPTERSAATVLLETFLQRIGGRAEALYILGDLFEVWLGDDISPQHYQSVIQGLRKTVAAGTPVYIMHGNRDFLVGERFADAAAVTLIGDPLVINLYGHRTLLTHGDKLCTDDVAYQKFRAEVRNPLWQQKFLMLSAAEREATASTYRNESKKQSASKPQEIMDVNQHAVRQAMEHAGVTRLIHGHTHRPGIHEFFSNERSAQRYVVGDWYKHGSTLRCDAKAWILETLNLD